MKNGLLICRAGHRVGYIRDNPGNYLAGILSCFTSRSDKSCYKTKYAEFRHKVQIYPK